MLYNSIIETIGNTPIVKLNKVDKNSAEIFVKLESRNPSGSVKDRPVLYIIHQLIEDGILEKGGTIVESTSGNTGIGLAMAGAALDVNIVLVMPDTMSIERRNLLKAYGAELILTPGANGMQGAGDKAKEIAKERNAPIFDQFNNPANITSHENSTAKEILEDLPTLDGFVAGVGTGGTVSGVGRVLKKEKSDVEIWAVEPEASPLLSQGKAGPHKLQGLGANFVPKNFDESVVDHIDTVSNEDAIQETVNLPKEEGILVGISSGANLVSAKRLAQKLGKDKKVLVILPDSGERYLSSKIFGESTEN